MLRNLSSVAVVIGALKINQFFMLFQEHHQSVKWLGSRSGPTDLGPNKGLLLGLLQTKVAASKERVKTL